MTLVALECRPDIAATLERAEAGARLSAQEAYAFEHTTSSELLALLQVADALRARHHGDVITYSRKVFLPLTNLCRDYCGYCTFRKDPGDPGAKTMAPDEVLAVATAGARLGCKEALFSLGDKPEALFPEMRQTLQYYGHRRTLDYLVQMCQLVLDQTPLLPHANPGVMGPRDLARLREVSPSMGIMLETTSRPCLARAWRTITLPIKIRLCASRPSKMPASSKSLLPPASSLASAKPLTNGLMPWWLYGSYTHATAISRK